MIMIEFENNSCFHFIYVYCKIIFFVLFALFYSSHGMFICLHDSHIGPVAVLAYLASRYKI